MSDGSKSAMLPFLSQIYKEYRDKFIQKVLKKTLVVPWAKYREIEIVEEILRKAQPEKCLEWGCGYGTLYFSERLKKTAVWISVEHEKEWAAKIEGMNRNRQVQIHHVPADHFPWSDPHRDGAYSDLKEYVDYPSRFAPFDFILVDGRARRDCLAKAHQLVREEGVVLLHDANRVRYHESFHLFKHQALFTDGRTRSGGIWIGSRGTEIAHFLDLPRQREIYRLYRRFGKRLH
ncbi:MAG: hypothetical protein EPO39_10285 [Candidatus Manganitrophaceae bacterium]|nr:MAG: hypothetical protein EPO39_10285 [Candidatus Manganitrophaceae bacterium]